MKATTRNTTKKRKRLPNGVRKELWAIARKLPDIVMPIATDDFEFTSIEKLKDQGFAMDEFSEESADAVISQPIMEYRKLEVKNHFWGLRTAFFDSGIGGVQAYRDWVYERFDAMQDMIITDSKPYIEEEE